LSTRPREREDNLKARVMKRLVAFGGFWWRQGSSPWSRAGVADILGLYKGYAFAIELKAPGAYSRPEVGTTPAQKQFLRSFRDAGGGYALVEDDEERLFERLQEIKRKIDEHRYTHP
jgi:hypothetical protein